MSKGINLPHILQYGQALHSDCSFFFSGDKTLATPERKQAVKKDIELLRNLLELIEKQLG